MIPAEKPASPAAEPRFQTAPRALHFPVEATVPEHKRHLELRTLLYLVLGTLIREHTIGSDQFVYWDPTDPSRCLAPDAFVRLFVPDSIFGSWKTWERGVPEVAVEIASDSDASEASWGVKLRRYQELGVKELVRFDPEETAEQQLRIWDRVAGELLERTDGEDRHLCRGLKLYWVVVPTLRHPAALRLARDAEGRDLVLTPEESEARAREAETRAREAAEQKVAELEALLRRRNG
ncbi:MAG TPA: Uma2 family endonuclease [Polyangiaceae bacterium]|nr:Uma2 family endonuclease [Polyangiaceae bacterium]